MIDPVKTLSGLANLPTGEGLTALRSAIAYALDLDAPIAKRQLGEILGYEGSNLHVTIDRLERGDRELKGGYLLQATSIALAASLHLQGIVVIPQWTFEYPVDDEDDAGLIFVRHNWFPRARFFVSPYSNADLTAIGAEQIGQIRSHDYPDEMHTVYCIAEDLLSDQSCWSSFYETAVAHLADYMNRSEIDAAGY